MAFALAAPVDVQAAASNFSSFTPLTAAVTVGALPAATPFLFGNPSWTQVSIADRATQLAAGQPNSGSWDMIDSNRSGPDVGRYLFTVFETGSNTGVQRSDRWTSSTVTLWSADAASGALRNAQYFDASRWTPWGSLLTAQEDWGSASNRHGRLFELTNPVTATAGSGNLVHRNAVARVSHEGLAFDQHNNLYYVDEFSGGSLYRFRSATPGVGASFFDAGINEVLRVGDGNTDGATGAFSWVPFTNAAGIGLAGSVTGIDSNGLSFVDGRATTDLAAFKGSNFNRPEDLEIQTLAGGRQILYMALTGSHQVLSIDLSTNQINSFVSRATIDAATGFAVSDAFSSPDNLAIDADGNIYIVEDRGSSGADSIWFVTDSNRNGVAESVSRWASLSTVGAEPSGLYFDVANPNIAFVNVMHPADGIDRMMQITAVPEPGASALMLGGLALLGVLLRRRRQR